MCTAKAFTIPADFLRAGKAYKFAIGTVAKDGNRSFIEAAFATARARMKETHPSNVGSARDEPAMSRLLFRNGETPALKPRAAFGRSRRPQSRTSRCWTNR
jgi:hypothetical protein